MIQLEDPLWNTLHSNYTNGTTVARLIAQALAGEPPDKWYDDLFQELCHQYTVSEAAYAAAPYLVKLASSAQAPQLELLVLLGACYAFSEAPAQTPIPEGLEADWLASARQAIPLAAGLLAEPCPSEEALRYLFSALAAFNGYCSLAQALEALDVVPEEEE